MTDADFKIFEAMMMQTADMTVMPNGKDPDRVIIALFDGLRGYSLDDVRRAVADHCRNNRFFPMLADIVARIDGKAEDRAAAAWAMVLKAIGRYGHTDSVRFPHPAVHYAIQQMGGWQYLCETLTNDSVPFRAKDFAGYYMTGERVADWTEASGKTRVPAYLIGAHEANNSRGGYDYTAKIWDTETGKPLDDCKAKALQSGSKHGGEVYDVSKLIKALAGRRTAEM